MRDPVGVNKDKTTLLSPLNEGLPVLLCGECLWLRGKGAIGDRDKVP